MTRPIFVALDTPDLERAKHIATRVRLHVGGIKLGLEFFSANGRSGIREMAELGLPIFLDLKFTTFPTRSPRRSSRCARSTPPSSPFTRPVAGR
jgi:orotidine-5'-phosphate decarboxylase